MTTKLTITCNNCKDEIGLIYSWDHMDDDMVCIKCYNKLLEQLGMDPI
jgi:hypothetical protein